MNARILCVAAAVIGIGTFSQSMTPNVVSPAQAAQRFHLEEATIADVQRAIRAKQITAVQLVNLYFKRIAAYNGTCVKGDVDPASGLMLGDLTPVENAGQINAYVTLNVRGKRSKTDTADNDPKMPDALEVARAQDAYFARTGKFVGPLHGIPIRHQGQLRHRRHADDRRCRRRLRQRQAAEGRHHGGEASRCRRDLSGQGQPRRVCAVRHRPQYARRPDLQSLRHQTRFPAAPAPARAHAVAANLAICALGTDTAGSVRFPPTANALVGMVATQGLVSRAGIIRCRSLAIAADRCAAPCADTAAVLEVVAGADPRDT